jgi:hypothetical protein
MVFYFSYFNIHKKLKKKIQIFLRQTINGSFKNIKLPNSSSYFFHGRAQQSYECKPNANVEARHLSKKNYY